MNQFLRFCVAGSAGFAIDAGVLQALIFTAGANPYLARVASFLVAASATWWLNRRYTFAVAQRPTRREWVRYTSFMILGALINYGAFALALTWWKLASAHPWIGVAIGSIAGLGVNFLTSRMFVFRSR